MKAINTIFLAMFISLGFAQVAPIDFETTGNGAEWTWNMGENGTNPAMEFVDNPSVVSPNTSVTVAKFTAEDAGADWALVHTDDIGTFTFDVEHSVIKVMVYKTVISNVGIKLEGDNLKEILIPNTKINEWEELTFDFSSEIGKSFSKLVFIPDFAPRSQENIIYWDNMTFNEGVAPKPIPEPSGTALLDFEPEGVGQAIRWSVFENGDGTTDLEFVDNPSVDDVNSSATVAKNVVDETSTGWLGAESAAGDVGPITWNSDLMVVKLKVYSTKATSFGVKMSVGAAAQPPLFVSVTEVNVWQELIFDFSSYIGRPETVNMNMFVVHPNGGTALGSYEIYFDDISFTDGGTILEAPTVAAPSPINGDSDVLALFSDLIGSGVWSQSIPLMEWIAPSNAAAAFLEYPIAGNIAHQMSSIYNFGIGTTPVDASAMTTYHIDIWTPNITSLTFTLENNGSTSSVTKVPVLNGWNSYDIALSDFSELSETNSLGGIAFIAEPSGTAILYYDNIYFHNGKGQSSVDEFELSNLDVYPNPTTGILNIEAQNGTMVYVYSVTGQIQIQKALQGGSLSIASLEDGIYFVRVGNEMSRVLKN